MNSINVNFENLTETERNQLLKLVEKSNKKLTKLSNVKVGETFKIGDVEFIKFGECGGLVTAVTKDILYTSWFGKNNNFKESKVFDTLNNEFLPKIADIIGYDNISTITTDLTTLDGLNPYGGMTSKISLPTLDFYRKNVETFDKYKVNKWWWLATPESAKPHCEPDWITCVSPSGRIDYYGCDNDHGGVRPFLCFVSSICVSYEN